MLTEELIKLFESNHISLNNFDHFDYAEAVQQLKKDYHSSINNNPKKKQIVQSFIDRCYKKMNDQNPTIRRKKCKDFMKRMELHKKIHDEKLEALQFINEVYDQKNKQLLFYPKINKKYSQNQKNYNSVVSNIKQNNIKLSASRNYSDYNAQTIRQIQNQDDQDLVSQQGLVIEPNQSQRNLFGDDQSNKSLIFSLSSFKFPC